MIPIDDDNPTLRTPLVTYTIVGLIIATWVFVQGAGFNDMSLVASVCNLGMVPGEITKLARLGDAVPIAQGLACVVDDEPINRFTPITSMFLHGGWGHLFGNLVFFWVFGNNVEDSMGRGRFALYYLLCGLAAAAAHVIIEPRSIIPTVGASGAISGVMGGYLILYPRAHVRMLFPPIFFFWARAWLVLIWWLVLQVINGLPQLLAIDPEASGGTAFWAHIGGFIAGVLLVMMFRDPQLVEQHRAAREAGNFTARWR
ncbi:MAG TPA: rhomboid family intramembrane serine protease [Gemmatimonadaceae bacterium]|nr:rhomboid family intramembrane serine protease [Gemmatimonadaceae bacterium]